MMLRNRINIYRLSNVASYCNYSIQKNKKSYKNRKSNIVTSHDKLMLDMNINTNKADIMISKKIDDATLNMLHGVQDNTHITKDTDTYTNINDRISNIEQQTKNIQVDMCLIKKQLSEQKDKNIFHTISKILSESKSKNLLQTIIDNVTLKKILGCPINISYHEYCTIKNQDGNLIYYKPILSRIIMSNIFLVSFLSICVIDDIEYIQILGLLLSGTLFSTVIPFIIIPTAKILSFVSLCLVSSVVVLKITGTKIDCH